MFSLTIGTIPAEVSDAPADAVADASLSLGQVVNLLEQMEYRQRALDAFRYELMAVAVQMATGAARSGAARSGSAPAGENELAYRSVRAEIATALNVSERAAEAQMGAAWSLRNDYGMTHQILAAGEISAAHARVIADAGRRLGVGAAPEVVARREAYQAEVFEYARRESVNRLRPIARRIAEQYAGDTLDERHHEEVRRRRVVVQEREDGMSDLLAYLPTAEAYAIHDRLTRIACEVERSERAESAERAGLHERDGGAERGQRAAAESSARRSRDEIRADAFAELLLGSDASAVTSCASSEAIRARVQVIVPVTALAPSRRSAAPVAELVGAGPIPLASARNLAAATPVWERVTVDAESGSVLQVDRYRPSEAMKRRLGARDQHCRFPGCRVPVARCDLDHTVDAAFGGPTSTANLAHLCRGHHVLKHHSEWAVRQKNDGELHWTSPTGRRYVDRPPSRVRFIETGPPGPMRRIERREPARERREPEHERDFARHPF
ncbi:HNH endonuclease signature motif containing protein [Leucobacter sp. USHLN154]|uniref:HNH endonuclease signature motif containing protein n=1 Tax=Leucobacter sp. USHLN154 TaxID=3081269 RepID=UPI003017D47C